jgi:hypothetical protein
MLAANGDVAGQSPENWIPDNDNAMMRTVDFIAGIIVPVIPKFRPIGMKH